MAKLGVIEERLRVVTRVDHFNPPNVRNDPMGATKFLNQFAALGVSPMQALGDACFERVYVDTH